MVVLLLFICSKCSILDMIKLQRDTAHYKNVIFWQKKYYSTALYLCLNFFTHIISLVVFVRKYFGHACKELVESGVGVLNYSINSMYQGGQSV